MGCNRLAKVGRNMKHLDLFTRAISAGIFLFVSFFVAGILFASEPAPPVIQGIRRLTPPASIPPTLPASPLPASPHHARPGDGPMCQLPIQEPYDGPWPTIAAVLSMEPATLEERVEVHTQMHQCSRGLTKAADPFLILAFYRYEAILGVPDEVRGILGATWCVESAFRTKSSRVDGPIRGDWRDGYAGAYGPFQLHSWAESPIKCGLSEGGRDDLFAAAACYWSRILVRKETVRTCRNPWPRSEALVANQGKYAALGCKAASEHWKELQRWRK